MGRHSAPDADQDGETDAAATSPAPAAPRGRHSHQDEDERPQVAPGARGDLQLLRQNPSLQIRCAAAVVASFLIFTLAVLFVGRADVYLIWVWIPTVLSGVLVGAILDHAHRKL